MRTAFVAMLLCGCTSGAVVDAQAPVAGAAVSAHVECTRNGAELDCRVSHDGAGRCAICWVVQLSCKNGRSLRTESCDEIAPGTEIAHPLTEIPDKNRCDSITGGALTSAWTRDCAG